MTTDKTPSDSDLQERCAEIVEWQRTGVLPGNALRNYAAKHWAGHTDALQMAERDTSALAMEQIAKWGSPVVAVEPWRSAVLDLIDDCPGLTLEQDRWLSRRVKELDFASTPQPTQAQAGAVLDLNAAAKMLAERMDYPWEHMPEQGRAEMRKHAQAVIEAAHGITKEGGQHAAN